MSLLPGGKLRSYRNGQPIYAADWMAEFNHLLKAYNVGQIDWQGANFWAGVPVACAPSQVLFAPPTDLQDYSFNIDYIYVNLGTSTNTCTGMTMLINGNPVGDIQSPDGTTPTVGVSDTCTVATDISADGCVSQFLVINSVVTTYYVINQLQYEPVLGDTVTFTPGYTFATGGCNPVGGTACPSVFTLFINGLSSGVSVCIPPGQTTGTTTTDIPLALGDQITIVPEGPPGGGDATAGIGGHAIPAFSLNQISIVPVLTRFYLNTDTTAIQTDETDTLVLDDPPSGSGDDGRAVAAGLAAGSNVLFLRRRFTFTNHFLAVQGVTDNTFQTSFKFMLAGYRTSGNAEIGSTAVKVKLLVLDKDVVDWTNPSPGEIKATLISNATSLFTAGMGTVNDPTNTNYNAQVCGPSTGGNVINQTAVVAGDILVLQLYASSLSNQSDLLSFTGLNNAYTNNQSVAYITGGVLASDNSSYSTSYIEFGCVRT